MKTVQCAHTPHRQNGFVATCRLWTASGGMLPQNHCGDEEDGIGFIYVYIYIYLKTTEPSTTMIFTYL